ncbi:hypothetical protein N7462_002236 [Penicillium macrosclerotiorum]|uniref:uncharacterized protein n=1 Tax=Penicillium macrosclerotiorum TaxID=303699 RepID=UPI0025468DB7|nr:uncharacterized protein N7462_002236 [Penicillium macrosclerotiorum]KAJ5692813.1 hypothetical protein N7462_002236 [Penicillium macrosclerotiorum]
MFASQIPSSPSTPFRQTTHYSPARPSPLGQRNSNIVTPPWTMGSPTRAGQSHKPTEYDENAPFSPVSFPRFSIQSAPPPQRQHQQPVSFFASSPLHNQSPAPMSPASPSPSTRPRYADRYVSEIANPMKTTTSLARSKTRKMFLNRIRQDRDTGRFEARGEQMMMAEHLADKRRWEECMAREADGAMHGVDADLEEDNMLPDEADVRALDEYVLQEQAMEMAMQENLGSGSNAHHQQPTEPNVSFSDEDYDDIFMGLSDTNQDMDMS